MAGESVTHTGYHHFRRSHKDHVDSTGWVSLAECVRTMKGHRVEGVFYLSYAEEVDSDVDQPPDEPEDVQEAEAIGCGSRKHHNL